MKLEKIMAVLTASLLAFSASGCGGKSKGSSSVKSSVNTASSEENPSETDPLLITEAFSEEETTEPVTKHISPVETVSAQCAVQYDADKTILRDDGSNTIKIPLSEFIEAGDKISSFTFIVEAGSNIGQYKGGCGISVTEDCPAGKKGWYQCPDFTAPTQGTYGEIKWEVPAEIKDYIDPEGEIMFGYWWGNPTSLTVKQGICSFERTRQLPVDGTVDIKVGKSAAKGGDDNIIKVKTAGLLPENAILEAVEYKVSGGPFGKFTGAFGYSSSAGSYQSPNTAVFTGDASLSLTWFVPYEAKALTAEDGEIMLGYWYGDQPSASLDSITVKYSQGDGSIPAYIPPKELSTDPEGYQSDYGFRSSAKLISEIKVGWNLGNSLECYGYKSWSTAAETAWGNPVTTKAMIDKVREAGFNAIRIPITWGEHMNGDTIDAEWLARVHEIVDYAYNEGMFVIINMHHDDYIWFKPSDAEYEKCRDKLMSIWKQISVSFEKYGDRLIFEGMNEPRTVDSAMEWQGGTPEERAVVNKYAQDFVDAVRSTGGQNSERTLIVTSYAASAETAAMDDVVIPNSGNIVLSLHYYAPWEFADGRSKVFDDAGKNDLKTKFSEIKSKFIDKGVPVIITEFGCVAGADTSVRAEFYDYYVRNARAAGIKCFVWDNNVFSKDSSYGIFHRGTLTWDDDLKDAIINASR